MLSSSWLLDSGFASLAYIFASSLVLFSEEVKPKKPKRSKTSKSKFITYKAFWTNSKTLFYLIINFTLMESEWCLESKQSKKLTKTCSSKCFQMPTCSNLRTACNSITLIIKPLLLIWSKINTTLSKMINHTIINTTQNQITNDFII